MSDENRIKYLSVSKISAAQKCPEQLRFRYEEHIPEPSSGTFHLGKVVHGVLERALRKVTLGESLPSHQDMDDMVGVVWEEIRKDEEHRENFICWQWDEDDPEEVAREGARDLVKLARTEVLEKIKPVFVEHDINMNLESDIGPFRIYGIIDLMEEGGMITDWKTAYGKVSDFARKQDVQIDGYGTWHHLYTKQPVAPMRKLFLVRRKGKQPIVDVANYQVTEAHREWFKRIAGNVWKMVQAKAYVPNPSGWWCSRDWCSFWGVCPQGQLYGQRK